MDEQSEYDGRPRINFHNTVDCELGEVIYTSAPSTLNTTAGHFGIVAQTPGVPAEIERQLARFWSYGIPPDILRSSPSDVPRFVFVPLGAAYRVASLTRVQGAGVDHTGRTNLIAHHFVAEIAELFSQRRGAADFIQWALEERAASGRGIFLDRWEGEPRYLERQRVRTAAPGWSPNDFLSSSGAEWGVPVSLVEEAVCAAVDTLRKFDSQQRMVVIVIKPGDARNVLRFLGAVLSALPVRKQVDVTAISHVWDLNDAHSGYSLTFTYPRSPYLERIKQRVDSRKPLVLDLAMRNPEVCVPLSPYITWLKQDQLDWNAGLNSPIPRLFDTVDPYCRHENSVFSIKQSLSEWSQDKSSESFIAVCMAGERGIADGVDRGPVESLLRLISDDTINEVVHRQNWKSLFSIMWNRNVPVVLRKVVRAAVEKNIVAIAANRPDLVAMASIQADGARVTKLLGSSNDVNVAPVLNSAYSFLLSSGGPDAIRVAAENWAAVGTGVVTAAWKGFVDSVHAVRGQPEFYRLILDVLMPAAKVLEVDHRLGKEEADVVVYSEDLAAVVSAAWRSISRRIARGVETHRICWDVVEEFIGNVRLPEAAELPRQSVADGSTGN
jgi:hypothetical protein